MLLLNESRQQYLLQKFATLETNRLILRPVTIEDAKDIYEYGSDPENTHYVFPTYESFSECKERIAGYFLAEPLGKYGIIEKKSKKLIGTVDLRVKNFAGELGYVLNKKYWGQGYMVEGCQALLKLGFEQLGLYHIYAGCLKENTASFRVMEKLNMTKEADIPCNRLFNGKLVSTLQYGMTKKDYLALKNKTI